MTRTQEILRGFARDYLLGYGLASEEDIKSWDSSGNLTYPHHIRTPRPSEPYRLLEEYVGVEVEKKCTGCGSSEFKSGRCVYCRSYR